ncbi:MAG: hypothetical protein J2P33_23505, partial [Actinobacteria bacterium]|nr:hypothetical protein [Actinomycetota bacterium]
MPAAAALRSRHSSTSAVASASARARCRGEAAVRKYCASVRSLRSGTSSGPSRLRASSAVS